MVLFLFLRTEDSKLQMKENVSCKVNATEEAEKQFKQALSHQQNVCSPDCDFALKCTFQATEREKLYLRAAECMLQRDGEAAASIYEEIVSKWPRFSSFP